MSDWATDMDKAGIGDAELVVHTGIETTHRPDRPCQYERAIAEARADATEQEKQRAAREGVNGFQLGLIQGRADALWEAAERVRALPSLTYFDPDGDEVPDNRGIHRAAVLAILDPEAAPTILDEAERDAPFAGYEARRYLAAEPPDESAT